MPAIFISYRKEDTPGAAAHLHKNLSETFGPGTVYMDVARSQPGRDVRQVVEEHLDSTLVVLVIIGQEWASATNDTGQRKLDNPGDVVRIEAAAALKRSIPVIPVLVQGAGMVQPAELPPELADLAFRNPVTLLQSQWGTDVETLVTLLQSLVHGQLPVAGGAKAGVVSAGVTAEPRHTGAAGTARERVDRAPSAGSRLGMWAAAASALAVVAVAFGIYTFMQPSPPPLDDAVAQAQLAAATAVAKAAAARGRSEGRAGRGRQEPGRARRSPPGRRQAGPGREARQGQDRRRRQAGCRATSGRSEGRRSEGRRTEGGGAEGSGAEGGGAQKAAEQKAAELKAAVRNAAEQKLAEQKLAEQKAPLPSVTVEPIKPPATPAPAVRPTLPPLASKTAKALTFPKWTLKSGGCGAGPLTIVGTARFSIERTSDGVVVTEEFRGSGNGFDVVVSGQVEYREEQPSYDIPTQGVWTSPNKAFKTTGTDRVSTSDGLTPRSANVLTFQSLCG